jgi:hypothetical protein
MISEPGMSFTLRRLVLQLPVGRTASTLRRTARGRTRFSSRRHLPLSVSNTENLVEVLVTVLLKSWL